MMDKAKEFLKKIELKNKKRVLDKKQDDINEDYSRYGLTDIVLDKQVELNGLRHELDIPDETNFISKDFAQ